MLIKITEISIILALSGNSLSWINIYISSWLMFWFRWLKKRQLCGCFSQIIAKFACSHVTAKIALTWNSRETVDSAALRCWMNEQSLTSHHSVSIISKLSRVAFHAAIGATTAFEMSWTATLFNSNR